MVCFIQSFQLFMCLKMFIVKCWENEGSYRVPSLVSSLKLFLTHPPHRTLYCLRGPRALGVTNCMSPELGKGPEKEAHRFSGVGERYPGKYMPASALALSIVSPSLKRDFWGLTSGSN
jgi:hypothetical protein